jgi:hypothetical protein
VVGTHEQPFWGGRGWISYLYGGKWVDDEEGELPCEELCADPFLIFDKEDLRGGDG